jgi:hypothetical protein
MLNILVVSKTYLSTRRVIIPRHKMRPAVERGTVLMLQLREFNVVSRSGQVARHRHVDNRGRVPVGSNAGRLRVDALIIVVAIVNAITIADTSTIAIGTVNSVAIVVTVCVVPIQATMAIRAAVAIGVAVRVAVRQRVPIQVLTTPNLAQAQAFLLWGCSAQFMSLVRVRRHASPASLLHLPHFNEANWLEVYAALHEGKSPRSAVVGS